LKFHDRIPAPEKPTRVLFCCTGVGIYNRGLESFFREAFDGLKGVAGLEGFLVKGAGPRAAREVPVWCLARTGRLAWWVGKMLRRNAYVAEQLSSLPAIARQIRRLRPEVVFYSDANVGFQLYRWRGMIGVPFRLLFSNGGPCHPPFQRTDFVQQVTPFHHEEAMRAGESPNQHFMVPYGIAVPPLPAAGQGESRRSLRERLGLPAEGPVVLSVGWIARKHKRMDYVIEEIARLPEPRPFLQLLGAMDEQSGEIVALGKRLLGKRGFAARSVPYEEVPDYYRASDCFALASLKEGFGRVYLEALMHGLPVIANDHPVARFVLGAEGVLANLESRGGLAALLSRQLRQKDESGEAKVRRWRRVADLFSWEALSPKYEEMFRRCAQLEIRNARSEIISWPSQN
jgi:glycosyltransferase involved in cell wall biosynthesis